MSYDELTRLREENARLRAEVAELKHLRERDASAAEASLKAAYAELETFKVRMRTALLRTIEAEDEVFNVREEAAAAIKTAKEL